MSTSHSSSDQAESTPPHELTALASDEVNLASQQVPEPLTMTVPTSAFFLTPNPKAIAMLLSATLVLLASYVYQDSLLVHGVSLPIFGKKDIVDTGYTKYWGNRTYPNTVAYLGVPYAEPPVGERRFRAPLPLDTKRFASKKLVDARAYPEFCIQGTTGGGDAGGAGSEDCLKVNIYAPVGANRDSNLPVMVYFHGGSYVFGNPRNWPFDHWVNQSPTVIFVSVYYRLSSFGFLSSSALLSDPTLADLNAGLLDQIESLRWVKKHIRAFGGDPGKVTINGQSAGGSSVELHLVAKEETLFHGAITQSVYRTPLPLPHQQDALFEFYANHAGCGTGTAKDKISCLRAASVSALARAQDAANTDAFNTTWYKVFKPVVDGRIITDYPTKLIRSREFKNVPLIVGATTNESLTRGPDLVWDMKRFFPSILDEDIHALLGAYPVSDFADSSTLQFQTITGDAELRCARTILAEAISAESDAWTYRYNEKVPGSVMVGHASENYMMFDGTSTGPNGTTTFKELSPSHQSFSEELIAYWISFVRSGNPNTFKLDRSPVWPKYTPQGVTRDRMVLQAEAVNIYGSHVEEEGDTETRRCHLVASQAETQQN